MVTGKIPFLLTIFFIVCWVGISSATTIVSPKSITIGGNDFGINITKAEERGSLELTPDFIMRMKQIIPASEVSSGFRLNIADSGDRDNVFWIAPDFTESSLLDVEDCPFLQLSSESDQMPRIASAYAKMKDSIYTPIEYPVDPFIGTALDFHGEP